jgi:hypothetical protein
MHEKSWKDIIIHGKAYESTYTGVWTNTVSTREIPIVNRKIIGKWMKWTGKILKATSGFVAWKAADLAQVGCLHSNMRQTEYCNFGMIYCNMWFECHKFCFAISVCFSNAPVKCWWRMADQNQATLSNMDGTARCSSSSVKSQWTSHAAWPIPNTTPHFGKSQPPFLGDPTLLLWRFAPAVMLLIPVVLWKRCHFAMVPSYTFKKYLAMAPKISGPRKKMAR